MKEELFRLAREDKTAVTYFTDVIVVDDGNNSTGFAMIGLLNSHTGNNSMVIIPQKKLLKAISKIVEGISDVKD